MLLGKRRDLIPLFFGKRFSFVTDPFIVPLLIIITGGSLFDPC